MELWEYERAAWREGAETVCGVDEAGAGPLMGPVYAAAVILPRELDIPGLNDSKKLTEKKREALYEIITAQAAAWSVARVEAAEIDEMDILNARMLVMQRAIDGLSLRPELALIDGNRDHGSRYAIETPHCLIVGGDGKSASIAAASILAKVSRDRYVAEVLDKQYPQYQFAKHKGYGTKLHYQMLDQAMRSNLETVRIIHGKGTGVLRAAVQQALRKNKYVKSFRLGVYGEGEDGVTIAEMR